MELERLHRLYDAYVEGFNVDGALPPMMELKRVHTGFVVRNARDIAEGEGFAPEVAEVCEAAALLHDTGRYEQLRRYNTFRDSDSVDHAVFSHDIVKERGWLAGEPHADAILKAVLYHNRRELPDGLDPLAETAANCVRDADKLDIFRVLEHQLATTDWRGDNEAFWSLPVMAPPSAEVLSAIRDRRPVDYQHIRSLADFVLIQVGWMRCGLRFATSRRLAAERGHLAYRRRFLAELTGGNAEIDALCRPTGGEITLDDVEAELCCGSRVLLMVRHGERPKIDNEDPSFGETLPLTDEGRRTARLLGERLKAFAGDVQFMSSPMTRTRQTAACIAEGMGMGGAPVEEDARLGNSSFYFADQREVYELFRGGRFFEGIFSYMAAGEQRGFRNIYAASDDLEAWALGRFKARLGIFATHDLYDGAFLYARGVKRDWTVENWVRFLDSAAIIVEPDGTKRYALVRSGLSKGTVGVKV
jgi:hypothetical protein